MKNCMHSSPKHKGSQPIVVTVSSSAMSAFSSGISCVTAVSIMSNSLSAAICGSKKDISKMTFFSFF